MLVGAVLAAPVHGQTVTIDEGTFTIFVGDRVVGQETFHIRRLGSGADSRIIANADVDLGARKMISILEAAPDLSLSKYQLEVSGDGSTEIFLQRSGRRFLVRVISLEGERERELSARDGSVIVEEGIAHHFHFVVPLMGSAAVVPVVRPRASSEGRLAVSEVDDVSMTIAGEEIAARRVALFLDEVEHHVWIDFQGRVLRVEVPSRAYRAERQTAPA